MKNRVKRIPEPNLTNAVKLTALQLNALTLGKRHTVLTPERIEALKNKKLKNSQAQIGA